MNWGGLVLVWLCLGWQFFTSILNFITQVPPPLDLDLFDNNWKQDESLKKLYIYLWCLSFFRVLLWFGIGLLQQVVHHAAHHLPGPAPQHLHGHIWNRHLCLHPEPHLLLLLHQVRVWFNKIVGVSSSFALVLELDLDFNKQICNNKAVLKDSPTNFSKFIKISGSSDLKKQFKKQFHKLPTFLYNDSYTHFCAFKKLWKTLPAAHLSRYL